MKKNILLMLTVLSLLLVGCKKQAPQVEETDEAIVFVHNEDGGILEYNLNFSEFVEADVAVEIVVDHYVNGEYVESPAKFEIESLSDEKSKYTLSWIHSHVDGVEKFALLLDEAVEEFEFTRTEEYDSLVMGFNTNVGTIDDIKENHDYYLATFLVDYEDRGYPSFTDENLIESLKEVNDAYVLRLNVSVQ